MPAGFLLTAPASRTSSRWRTGNQVLASNTNDGIMGTLKMNPKNKQDVKDNPDKYAFHNM